jgi:hypothetical protein
MLEIEFRGKDNKTEEWRYGSLNLFNTESLILEGGKYNPVYPETIGQYTGLKDKDGRKIFEGDVVSIRGDKYQVKYRAPSFMLFPARGIALIADKGLIEKNNVNIIGNIHDMPEMKEK